LKIKEGINMKIKREKKEKINMKIKEKGRKHEDK
jgi:hypothetical protein